MALDMLGIRYFVSVAEHLSYTRAGEELRISQSAISRKIMLLEGELGFRLFDRLGRGIVLSSAGAQMVEYFNQIICDVELLEARAQDIASGRNTIVRIGATPQTLKTLVAPVLQSFRRKHTDINFQIHEAGSRALVSNLICGDIDFAVGGFAEMEDMELRQIFPIRVLVVVPHGHELDRKGPIDVTELKPHNLLLPNEEFSTRRLFDAACDFAGITPNVIMESRTPDSLIEFAHLGHGVAIVPSTCEIDPVQCSVRALHYARAPVGGHMHIVCDPRKQRTKAVDMMIDAIDDWTKENYPGRDFVEEFPKLNLRRKAAS